MSFLVVERGGVTSVSTKGISRQSKMLDEAKDPLVIYEDFALGGTLEGRVLTARLSIAVISCKRAMKCLWLAFWQWRSKLGVSRSRLP